MSKNTTVKQAKNAIIQTRKARISTVPTFMIGYPSETRATAMETVKFIKETRLSISSTFFATPFPGTVLFEEAVRAGKIKDTEEYLYKISGGDAHDLLVNLTSMGDEELIQLKQEVLRKVKMGFLKKTLSAIKDYGLFYTLNKIYIKCKKFIS